MERLSARLCGLIADDLRGIRKTRACRDANEPRGVISQKNRKDRAVTRGDN